MPLHHTRYGTHQILSNSPDFNLLASVVLQALDDLERADTDERAAAWAWLTSDRLGLCSFRWYCQTLSLNRALVLRIAREKHTEQAGVRLRGMELEPRCTPHA